MPIAERRSGPLASKQALRAWTEIFNNIEASAGADITKTILAELLSDRVDKADARVLEAMCGSTSYFAEGGNVAEVVGLDVCPEALDLYQEHYPGRKTILYNLDEAANKHIPGLADASFDILAVVLGVDYLADPALVYKEFARILTQKGRLLVVGGTATGYPDLIQRWFNPVYHSEIMARVGFNVTREPLKQIERKFDASNYFLVQGIKS